MFWFVYIQYRISELFVMLYIYWLSVRRYHRLKTIALIGGCYLLTGLIDWIEVILHRRAVYSVGILLVEISVILFFSLIINEFRDFRGLFTGLSSYVYVQPANIISLMVLWKTKSILFSVAAQFLLNVFLAVILILGTSEEYRKEQQWNRDGWGALCILPVLFYSLIYSLLIWPVSVRNVPQNYYPAIIVILLMVYVFILVIQIISRRRREFELRHEQAVFENYIASVRHEAEILSDQEKEFAVLRHDMRHYVNMATACIEKNDLEKLKEMIQYVQEDLQRQQMKSYCENVYINGMITHLKKKADEFGVAFHCRIEIPNQFSNNSFELGLATVISNLLENAVQAAIKTKEPEKRFVSISLTKDKGRFLLEITNSFQGKLELNDSKYLKLTAGEDGHGYGLRSVQSFIDRYQAVYDCDVKDQVLTIHILVDDPAT